MDVMQHRSRFLFILFVMISLLLICIPSRFVYPVKGSVGRIFSPFKQFALGLQSTGGRVAGIATSLQKTESSEMTDLRRENGYLRDRLIEMLQENVAIRSKLHAMQNLQKIPDSEYYIKIFADVIFSYDASGWRRTLMIAKGSRDGIEKGMVVVWGHHLVGKIMEVSESTSVVQLMTDGGFKVGAIPVHAYVDRRKQEESTDPSLRTLGFLEGGGQSLSELKWITRHATVKENWLVTTAGDVEKGVPKGIIAGVVKEAYPGQGVYYHITVEPLIQYENLEYVVILKKGIS